MGKMNKGTVNWLNNAKPAKTFGGSSISLSICGYKPNVTTVTNTEEICVMKAVKWNVKQFTVLFL